MRTTRYVVLGATSSVLNLAIGFGLIATSVVVGHETLLVIGVGGVLFSLAGASALVQAARARAAHREERINDATAFTRAAAVSAKLSGAFTIVLGLVAAYVLARTLAPAPLDCTRGLSAPEGRPEQRSEWAQRGMGRSYAGIADWVRRSSFVSSRVGEVLWVAPVGAPNCTRDYFTDGRFTDLNLEVRGDRSTGVLRIENGQVFEGMLDGEVHFRSATWMEPGRAPIAISDTDRTQEEFASPSFQLDYWTKIIERAERIGSLAYVQAYEKRAEARAALGDARAAAQDEERAITRHSSDAEKGITNPGSSTEEHGWTQALRDELRRLRLKRAEYLDAAGEHASATAERAKGDVPDARKRETGTGAQDQ